MTQVAALTLYPVKSMRGIGVTEAVLTPRGLLHDRRWMLLNAHDRFVTQRDLPRLALIGQALDAAGVRLSLPDRESLHVPFDDSAQGERIRTAVWGDACEVIDVGGDSSRWLSDALESSTALRLVRMAPDWRRPQRHPELMGETTRSLFADGAPYLVANEDSLQALNSELVARDIAPVPINRFRPNIVVRGLAPFNEHQVALLEHAQYAIRLCYPCERCVVTTIDQGSGVPDPTGEPFKTLRDFNPMSDRPRAPAFAQNSALARGAGAVIRVGDELQWRSEPGEHPPS